MVATATVWTVCLIVIAACQIVRAVVLTYEAWLRTRQIDTMLQIQRMATDAIKEPPAVSYHGVRH